MLKEFAIKALQRLKDNQAVYNVLYNNGVNLCDYEAKTGTTSIIEEAIALIICGSNENSFEEALDNVQWWLYENVDKVFFHDGTPDVDVTEAKAFVEYLFKVYNPC